MYRIPYMTMPTYNYSVLAHLQKFIHSYRRKYVRSYVRTQRNTYVRIRRNTYVRIRRNTYVSIRRNTYVHIRRNTYVRLRRNTYMRIRRNTYVPIRRYTYVRIRRNTYVRMIPIICGTRCRTYVRMFALSKKYFSVWYGPYDTIQNRNLSVIMKLLLQLYCQQKKKTKYYFNSIALRYLSLLPVNVSL